MLKKILCLLCALMCLTGSFFVEPAYAAPQTDYSETDEDDYVRLVSRSKNGSGYAEWKSVGGNKLGFRVKLHSHTPYYTIKAVELYAYATDIWDDRIYGETTVYYDTTKIDIRPEKTKYSVYLYLPERDEIEHVYCGIKRYVYEDYWGVEHTIEKEYVDYYRWDIQY